MTKNKRVTTWSVVVLSAVLQQLPSSKFILSLQWRFINIWNGNIITWLLADSHMHRFEGYDGYLKQ